MNSTHCSGCGLAIAGGTEACQSLFEEITARDFSDVAYGRRHRMIVDVYALQHPDRYCVSGKSLAAHLCGLCELLERGGNPALPNERLRRWLDGNRKLDKPPLPASRGRVTIAAIRDAATPEAHAAAVEAWARDVWAACAPLHRLARFWLDAALADRTRPKRP